MYEHNQDKIQPHLYQVYEKSIDIKLNWQACFGRNILVSTCSCLLVVLRVIQANAFNPIGCIDAFFERQPTDNQKFNKRVFTFVAS